METADINYNPFEYGQIDSVVGATPQQKEIWLASQFSEEASLAYNQGLVFELNGKVKEDILRDALIAFGEKFPLTKAAFSPDGKFICVNKNNNLNLHVDDQSRLAEQEFAVYLEQAKNKAANTPFNLTFGPLFRATLIKSALDKSYIIVAAHHSICDGVSLGIIGKELPAIYRSLLAGDRESETSGEMAIADIQSGFDAADCQKSYHYWADVYSDVPAPTELPSPPGFSRPSKRTFNSQRLTFELSPQDIEAMEHVAGQLGCTFPVLTYSLFVALLYRLTNHDDLVVGLPASARRYAKQAEQFGHFVSILPLRHKIDTASTFESLVKSITQNIYTGSAHAAITLNDLINCVGLPRDSSRVPLVTVTFNTNQSDNVVDFGDCSGSYDYLARNYETFELAVNLIRRNHSAKLLFDFNSDLFDDATVSQWAEGYLSLLRAITDAVSSPLVSYNIVPEEQLQLMADWNSTQQDYPREKSIAELISIQAESNPDNTALVCQSKRYSYSEIQQQSNRLANYLSQEFQSQPFLAAVCMDRSMNMVVTLLGILKAGGAYLPLDPEYPAERIAYILEDSQAALAITERSRASLLNQENSDKNSDCHILLYEDLQDDLESYPDTYQAQTGGGENLAYIIYTSGSTGNPKGVRVKNQNVVNFLCSMQQRPGFTCRDNLLAVTTFSFDISVLEIFLPLISGANLTLATKEESTDPANLKNLLESAGATVLQATPATWKMLIDAGWSGNKGLKGLIGGEALPTDLVQPLLDRIGELWNMYGPTETTVWSTCQQITDASAPILIGKPIGNTQLYIADEHGNRMPLGAYGELYIGGDGVTEGYHNRPDLTDERFIENRWDSGANGKLYRTGDLVQLTNEGVLRYIARLDNQVKIRGYRIELGEIESAIVKLDAVHQCVVTTQEVEPGDVRLVAYLILKAGHELASKEYRKSLTAFLPGYMVPQHFITVDKMPLTPSGKIDRKALPKLETTSSAAAKQPEKEMALQPLNEFESQLIKLWQETLKIDSIDVTDNFLELGGHSILAIELRGKIRDQYGIEISLADLFGNSLREIADSLEESTKLTKADNDADAQIKEPSAAEQMSAAINKLSGRLGNLPDDSTVCLGRDPEGAPGLYASLRKQPGGYQQLAHIDEYGEFVLADAPVAVDYDPFTKGEIIAALPMSDSQKEVWLAAHQNDDASRAFNLTISIDLQGVLDLDVLQSAIEILGNRHESLRTCFNDQYLLAVINQKFHCELDIEDISSLPAEQKASRIKALKEAGAKKAFDLVFGPLVCGHVVKLSDQEFNLLLTFHHIIADGWSINLFAVELGEVYSSLVQHQEPELPPAVQFSAYLDVQNSAKENKLYKQSLDYWKNKFPEVAPTLELPINKERPRQRTYEAGFVRTELDVEQSEAVLQRVNEVRSTFFTFTYAAFVGFLNRVTQQQSIVVGVPAAGQSLYNKTRLFGNCVNMLPVINNIESSDTFAEFLSKINQESLAAIEHSYLTFSELIDKVHIDRSPNRIPLVAVTFNVDQEDLPLHYADLKVDYRYLPRNYEVFELATNIIVREGRIAIEWHYNSHLFEATYIKQLQRDFATFLSAAAQSPGKPLSNLPLISTEEQARIFELCYGREHALATNNIHKLFEKQVERTPDAVAAVFEGISLTYEELNNSANRIAQLLINQHNVQGKLVGLCVERSEKMLAILLGILKAGAAYLPLDPEYPRDRIAYILDDAKVSLLVTESQIESVDNYHGTAVKIDEVWEQLVEQDVVNPDLNIDGSAACYVIYTSGSTGKPKGVQVAHQNVVNFLQSMANEPGLTDQDKLLAVTTLSFDIAVLELYLPISVGAEVHIASRDTSMDGEALIDYICEHGISMLQATPATWRMMLQSGWEGAGNLKGLIGGEALPKELLPDLLPKISELWNMYGPTETTVWSTCQKIVDPQAKIYIGRPIDNTQVYIVDRHNSRLPLEVPGELCIGGEGVTLGYLGRPELTDERFIDIDSENGTQRVYKTGDLVRMCASGELEYLNRLDNQVKIRGFRIELGEIEASLSKQEGIDQCVVTAHQFGPSDHRLVAYIKMEKGAALTNTEMRKGLKRDLPDYMIPQFFIEIDNVPLTPSGKVDRKSLPDPAPDLAGQREHHPPTTPTEIALAEIWQAALRIEQIDVDDFFFDIGGHSLLAVEVVRKVQQKFSVKIAVADLLMNSFNQIAAKIDRMVTPDKPVAAIGTDNKSEVKVGKKSFLKRLFGG